jgi:hypothetical protein
MYFVKPLPSQVNRGEQMYLMHFQCDPSPIKLDNEGYVWTMVENVPAAHDEPVAPSRPNLEPWGLLYYRENGPPKDADKFWSDEGKKSYSVIKQLLKSSDELKAGAAEAVSGAGGDAEKVAALVAYLHKHVRLFTEPEVTSAERENFIQNLPKDRQRNSAEIFKSGIATSGEMNVVFAALAEEAHLEARPALTGDRSEKVFDPKMAEPYFLNNRVMAVKAGDFWKVFDVSDRLLTPGMVPWHEEGMSALVTDPKAPTFVSVPFSPPETSTDQRTARFALSADGTLEGDVEESYTGHRAEAYRREVSNKSDAQREEWLKDRVTRLFPESEVTAIQFANITDPTKPLLGRYHVEAPRYAQVTGKRLFLQPNAFRRAQGSPFTATERRFPVEFQYAWRENDQLTFTLPKGYDFDNADSPGDLNLGEPGFYHVKMSWVRTPNQPTELRVEREFVFGRKGQIMFAAKDYPSLKRVFDEIQARDGHAISLKGN